MMSTHLVIFGGGRDSQGFIGGTLYRELTGTDEFPVTGFSSRDADLTVWEQAEALAARIPSDALWIVVAARNPDDARPAIEGLTVNAGIAANLVRLAELARPSHIVYLSSIDVYGRHNLTLPLSEESPVQPESYYAVGKLAAEGAFKVFCGRQGIPLTILRLPGVYGAGDTHHGPVRAFLDAAILGRQAIIQGNGAQRRDLLYVRDIPNIIAAVVHARLPGTFNAVTGSTTSINEIVSQVERLSGTPLRAIRQPEMPQYDIEFAAPRLLELLPALRLTPFAQGLAETYAHCGRR